MAVNFFSCNLPFYRIVFPFFSSNVYNLVSFCSSPVFQHWYHFFILLVFLFFDIFSGVFNFPNVSSLCSMFPSAEFCYVVLNICRNMRYLVLNLDDGSSFRYLGLWINWWDYWKPPAKFRCCFSFVALHYWSAASMTW